MSYRAPPSSLHGLVEARRHQEAPAVRLGTGPALSYRALDQRAETLACALAAQGVGRGARVGLYLPKSVEAVAAILAILKRGAAYVPVDPSAPPERARTIFAHCGVEVVFAAGRPLARLAGAPAARVLLVADDGGAPAGVADQVVPTRALAPGTGGAQAVTDADLAYVLYTSGSTGQPKGVAITHGQSLTFVRAAAEVFALEERDVLVSHAPFNFDLSVIDLYCAFAAGASVVLLPEAHLAFPAQIARTLAETRVSVWNSVPSALIQLTSRGALAQVDLSALRLVMFAGEPYPIPALRALAAALPAARLLNVYGQTEANSSTYYEVKALPADDGAALPVGKTFPNYEVFVLDEAGRPVATPGVEGELYVASGAVALGYYADPERTRAAFVPHPLRPAIPSVVYRTGDRFLYDAHGDLVFRGRRDSAVKVRGFRVEPGEVEAAALALPGVEQAALVALPDPDQGHRLILFLSHRPGGEPPAEAAVLEGLGQRLPRYMLPERVHVRPKLPWTPNGKIDRRALAAEVESGTS